MDRTNKKRTQEEIKTVCSIIGYEYIDGYEGSDSTINLRCPNCKTIIKRKWGAVRKIARGYQKTFACSNCTRLNEEKRKAEIEQEKEKRKAERERELWSGNFKQTSLLFCKKCNRPFITSYGREYCSKQCAMSIQYSKSKDKRLRKIKGRFKDDITVKELYKRDNGICYLCGGKCDMNDYTLNENGAFIVGYNYPSIDHVIPLAKGGVHSWENVKLAHFICNTRKRDSIITPPHIA